VTCDVNFLNDDIGELMNEFDELGGGDGSGVGLGISLRDGPFEYPGGGSPELGPFCSLIQVLKVSEFVFSFGEGEFSCELGVAFGGIEDRVATAASSAGGRGDTTAGLNVGEDLRSSFFVEKRRAWHGTGSIVGY
jgi:hypothetical protein